MVLLLNGAAARRGSGDRVRPGRSPEAVGEIGMICSCTEPQEDLLATEVCCVKVLHRSLFLDCLRRCSDVKWHFEAIARRHMQDSSTEQDPGTSNIYTLPFFRGCDSRFIYKLDLHLDRHVFFSGEVIVEEETEGEDMYILYSGCMEAHSRGLKVGTLKGGQCFGEMAVLGLVRKRTATVVARSLCDVRILSRRLFEDIMAEFPEERARFNSLAATRHNVSQEKCIGGRIKSLCRFFEDCCPEFAEALGDPTEDRLFMEGEALMREGEEGDWLALLHHGSAAVSSGGVRVDILGRGDLAGEVGALGLSPTRTATVTALETCFVQVLHRLQLKEALEQFPEERRKLRARAARRLERRCGGASVRQIDLFRGSPRPFLDLVDSQTQRWVFFQGDFMVREGTPGRQLLLLSRKEK
ncbi:unnamed protein product [Prorocentrum cordatum]|uniref:Cyclic nucleotide-binding domain-containing protein n=1 Tax=Prorocentrum cordatum TaxID=2364126 RepID=A0ABN9WZH3_9DINO|nr:unnamed protein product [Polarella glacialis]